MTKPYPSSIDHAFPGAEDKEAVQLERDDQSVLTSEENIEVADHLVAKDESHSEKEEMEKHWVTLHLVSSFFNL